MNMGKRKVIALFLGLVLALSAFLILQSLYSSQVKKITKIYMLNWEVSDLDLFEKTLQGITTESFQEDQLLGNLETFTKRNEEGMVLKSKIDQIYLIDKRKAALQAVVYFTLTNVTEGYDNPMQANIIFFKEYDKWKIQNAYIMERSDAAIPKSAKEEERFQAERAVYFQELIKTWTNTRNFAAKEAFIGYFSKDADRESYLEAFEKESETLKKDKVNFYVETTAIAVDSSTDTQARLLVINQQVVNGQKQMIPLVVNLILEEEVWKIKEIFQV
ncbi:MAG: hypothetical protein AB7G87_01350 [Clostridia bacterium]